MLALTGDRDVAAALSSGPLLRSLVAAFGHDTADVRKAVTFCLVDLRLVRPPALPPCQMMFTICGLLGTRPQGQAWCPQH